MQAAANALELFIERRKALAAAGEVLSLAAALWLTLCIFCALAG